MTDTLLNYVSAQDESISGNIANLSFDIDFVGWPVTSDNEKAPKYRLYANSPRGRKFDIGGIRERKNQNGDPYLTITIDTGHSKFYANLGRYPGQDDENLLAIIPNEYLNKQNNLS